MSGECARTGNVSQRLGLLSLARPAVLIAALLLVLTSSSETCQLPRVDVAVATKHENDCQEWNDVCLDQGTIVYYGKRPVPINYTDYLGPIVYNLPDKLGIGDRYKKGAGMLYDPLYIRPATDMEESKDLQSPRFSNCTVPTLWYGHFPFNMGEVLRLHFAKMVRLQKDGMFDRRVTIIPGLPSGTRVPGYTRFWYRTLSDLEVVSLAQLSSRRPPSAPSAATAEGRHVRCFRRMAACRLGTTGYGLNYYAAMEHVVRHYADQLAVQNATFANQLKQLYNVSIPADPAVLKVVFVRRPEAQTRTARNLTNEPDLLARCNAPRPEDLPPPAWGTAVHSYFCFPYIFGADPLMDVWLMQQMDVLFGVHGAGLNNAFYMRPYSSVIEVRPYGFAGSQGWANNYMRWMTSTPGSYKLFWWGIDTMNASNSQPGHHEATARPRQDDHISRNGPKEKRDRHVSVPWPALRHHLLNVAAARRRKGRYLFLRQRQVYYVTEELQQAEPAGSDEHLPMDAQRNFTSAEAVWEELVNSGL